MLKEGIELPHCLQHCEGPTDFEVISQSFKWPTTLRYSISNVASPLLSSFLKIQTFSHSEPGEACTWHLTLE